MPTALTPPAPAKVVWRAGVDRVDHAHAKAALRTVCGLEIVLERLAWPAFRKCMVCRAAVEQIPETELRALHGDR